MWSFPVSSLSRPFPGADPLQSLISVSMSLSLPRVPSPPAPLCRLSRAAPKPLLLFAFHFFNCVPPPGPFFPCCLRPERDTGEEDRGRSRGSFPLPLPLSCGSAWALWLGGGEVSKPAALFPSATSIQALLRVLWSNPWNLTFLEASQVTTLSPSGCQAGLANR